MATTYGEIANKLSKKLGEYEKVLETGTEPTEIETAKRSIERIQQAMALLKASQQNHPEAQSLEEQGMEQGMMPQGMPMQEQQMPQQGMPQQQMAMPQQQMAMPPQQMQQQMPQQQQMGYAQTGGYLPAYQSTGLTIGGGTPKKPFGDFSLINKKDTPNAYALKQGTGIWDTGGGETDWEAQGTGGGGETNWGAIGNAAGYGLGVAGSMVQSSNLVNSSAEQEEALNKARGTSPLVDQWALNSQFANQVPVNNSSKFPNYDTSFYQTGGNLPSYQTMSSPISNDNQAYFDVPSFISPNSSPTFTNTASGSKGIVVPKNVKPNLVGARENMSRILKLKEGNITQDQLNKLGVQDIYNDSNTYLQDWRNYTGQNSINNPLAGPQETGMPVDTQTVGPLHRSQPLDTTIKSTAPIIQKRGGNIPSYQTGGNITFPYELLGGVNEEGNEWELPVTEDSTLEDLQRTYNTVVEVGDEDSRKALEKYFKKHNVSEKEGVLSYGGKGGKKEAQTPAIEESTTAIEGLPEASDEELEQSKREAANIGAEEAVTQIQAEQDRRGIPNATGPASASVPNADSPIEKNYEGVSPRGEGFVETNLDPEGDGIYTGVDATPDGEEGYNYNPSPTEEEGDKYTRKDPFTFEERDRQQNPALSALGLAPTIGNLYMGAQDKDYYPGFKNPYADQLGRDLGDMRGLLADSETELMKDRFYDPRHELVKARHRFNTGMQNSSDASGGSARFALQNRAQGQLASDTDQILTKARNINAQWNDPARKAQGLMGLAGAYGQVGQMGYGVGRDVQAEQAKKWDLDARTDATSRAFTGAGLSQLGQWAQLQQQMGNQYDIDSERSKLLSSMYPNYGYTGSGWKFDPQTGEPV